MVKFQMLETVKMSALSWPEDGRLRLNCPDCDSETGQWRGYRKMKSGVSVHRRRCTHCGRWFYVARLKLDDSPLSQAEQEERMRDHLKFDAWMEAYEQRSSPEACPAQAQESGCSE